MPWPGPDPPPLNVAAAQAMTGADTQRITLGSQVSGANAIIVLLPDGTGYLSEHTLQPLPPERTYQLWAIIDGKIISAGILGSDPGVVPFRIDPQGFVEQQIDLLNAGYAAADLDSEDLVVVFGGRAGRPGRRPRTATPPRRRER